MITQAARQDNLTLIAFLAPHEEHKVLVEYPCGAEFTRQRGYSRFVEFRNPMEAPGGRRYALIRTDSGETSGMQMNITRLAQCGECGFRGAIEYGRCAICGHPRLVLENPNHGRNTEVID